MELMNLGRKVLGQRLFSFVMKKTVYGQFVMGEDKEKIKAGVQRLTDSGVGSILDYAVEEDLDKEQAKDIEKKSRLEDGNHVHSKV